MRGATTMLILILAACTATAQNSKEQIANVWENRQVRVKSAEFRISATGFYPKSGKSGSQPTDKKRKEVLLSADTTTTWTEVIVLDGPRIRVESKGTLWAGDTFRYRELTTVLNGNVRRKLELGDQMNPQGVVSMESNYFEAKGQNARPIIYCFRGISPGLRLFFLDELKPTGLTTTIDGRRCEQFVLRRIGGRATAL